MLLPTTVNALPRRDVRSLVETLARAAGIGLRPCRYVGTWDGAAQSRLRIRYESTAGPLVVVALYATDPLASRVMLYNNGLELGSDPFELGALCEGPNVDGVGLVCPMTNDASQFLDGTAQGLLTGDLIVDGFHLIPGSGDLDSFVVALRALGQPWVTRLTLLGSGPDVGSAKEAPDLVEVRRLVVVEGGVVSSSYLQVGRTRYTPRGDLQNTTRLGGNTVASQASQVSFWLRRAEQAKFQQIDPTGLVRTTLLLVGRRLPETASVDEWV